MSEPETPETPRELHPASQGEDVTNLQTALFNAGYDPGPVDGVYGTRTVAAIQAFQDEVGIPEAGATGPPTWRALSERDGAHFLRDFPLRRMLHGASEGPEVAELQEALAAAGLISGQPNGVYSTGTESAVKRFQNNEGLPVTGVLDPATRALLMPVRIGDRLLSPAAAEVMTLAARLVGNNPEQVPGPPAVLVAALKIAIDTNRDAVAVAFTEELPGLESSHPFTEREPVLRRVAEAAGSISDFSLLDPGPVDFGRIMRWPLPQILGTSADLATEDRSPTVDVVHLLVACVSGRVEVLPDAVPSVLGLSGEDLKSRLGLAIQTVRPITLSQPWPPWWAVALDIAAPLEEPIDKPAEAGAPIEPETGAEEESPEPANFRLSGGISGDAVPSLDSATKFVDELDVQTYVSMLALAIADRNTPMPLSVGLFGEWGTGKSYFMRLLQQEIGQLTSRSGEAGSTFLSDIVHINFNAWHYSDANLWASLADEIFEQLAGRDGVADPNADRRDKLREELGRTLNKRKELEESTTQARARAEELRGELEAEKANHEASAIGVAKALWADPEVKKQLDVAADKLGLNKEDEIQRLADELSGTHRDARSTWQLLASARWSTGRAVTLILVLLLGLGAVLIADQAEIKWAGLAGIAAAATSATKFLSGLRQGMVALQSGMVKARELKRTATSNDLKDKIGELQAAEAGVQVASAQLDEVVAKVGQLGRELAELNPGSRLYAFLAERAASAEYQQQLGIVSMIRKDFEQLVALIATWTKERDNPPPSGDTAAVQPPLDRIVLYIDDLDRCEPSQVVDVLQAVHLLLAMNLFVVVVGVDPRWLQRSLRLRYQGIMGASDEVEQDGFRGSTPNDYLEKIFNIPLVLPAMDKKGFSKLLRVMAYGSSKPTPSPDLSPKPAGPSGEAIFPVDPAPIPSEHPATKDAPPAQQADTPAQETAAQAAPESPRQDQIAATEAAEAAATIAAAVPLTGQEGSAVDNLATGKQPVIQPLTDRELEFLDELGPLVRTPRSAKRMFNLYRMLRSARSVEEASEFLGTERRPGEYQAVAQLLAILTAHPKVLGHIITARPDPGEIPVRLGGLLHRPPDASWKEFVEGLALNYYYAQDGTTIIAENALLASIPPADRPAWSEIATALIELLPKVKQNTIRPYQEWAPQVARFSFLLSPFAAEVEMPAQPAEPDSAG
jgi:hypothetical protein